MTDDDIKILEAQTGDTLAIWWCQLNRLEWPDGLPHPEPETFKPGDRRGRLMCWIIDRIGMGECLREWNRATLPGAAFDEWWNAKESR